MAQTAVLEFEQALDATPEHYLSRTWARAFIAYRHNGRRVVEMVKEGLLRIVVDLTFGKIKALVRTQEPVIRRRPIQPVPAHASPRTAIESLPRPEVEGLKFMLKGQVENHAQHQRRVRHWLCFPQLFGTAKTAVSRN